MRQFSRLYEQTAEFRARCKAFDFAAVAHAVLDVALATKKALGGMLKGFVKGLRAWEPAKPTAKKPRQLVLELDALAQIPLFY